ncbi:YdaS family helix-turn-helix protein [Acidovorax sp. PRC11]|uniref:YdaS family helix-turn-helix protein n=1 Tax=Acidovorax sp. PRC11 TaxID=2962592 RepID=UPI0028812599|nr:YdaS family helix-turn-helix protein [Acidovorax sp. PRC11]MDT0138078.1 YdaS family helix-turn-helix protein [Acidovorax sp. PRC11]
MLKEPTWAAANRKATEEIGGHAAVARHLGFPDRRNVFPWTSGKRIFPEVYCFRIERAAKTVTRRDLRPDDWHLIWPELADQAAPVAARESSQSLKPTPADA